MRLSSFFLVSLSLGFALAESAPNGDPVSKKDLDLLQGSWRVVELMEKGEALSQKELMGVGVFILGDRLSLYDDAKFREEITLKLDATTKTKAIDLAYSKGPNAGKLERGIYKLDGDTLRLCMNETNNGPRPTEFTSTKTNNCSVAVLQRVKK